jgi:hypothetical protein
MEVHCCGTQNIFMPRSVILLAREYVSASSLLTIFLQLVSWHLSLGDPNVLKEVSQGYVTRG